MSKTVLILGASGKIGRHASEAFARAGWTVRTFDRRTGNLVRDAQGADVIVNGWNPPKYHDWARLIPALTRDVIAAAKASGATVIVPGNVYNFGDEPGEWSEATPHRPTTKKGRIREDMERAYEASGVQTIVLRAGNFIDPNHSDDVMSLLFLRAISRGKITVPGAPDVLQAYCYVPDWARAAVALAEKRNELGRFEDVPFAGHAFTAEDLRVFLSRELGRELGYAAFPWWLFSLLSPFWELAREMREMRYLWNTPHSLSGTKLARLLPEFRATPLQTVWRAALEGAKAPAQQAETTAGRWSAV
jgi:nucleoside-diphosphate-sugar epimerase